MPGRGPAKRRKLDLLFWLYDGQCFWCAKPVHTDSRLRSTSMSIDELKPTSRGGMRVLPNQVPAHRGCNMKRGNVIAPHAAFARHHETLRSAGIEVEELSRPQSVSLAFQSHRRRLAMAQSKNDPQAERDRAQRDKNQATVAKAATVDNDREAVAAAARMGGNGPGGLNTGPSDTVSADPHNPTSGRPLYRDGQDNRMSDGMGHSPPQGAAPTSDRPQGTDAQANRAAMSGSDDAKGAHAANQADRQKADATIKDADDRIAKANDKLAAKQSEGEGDRQRKEAHKETHKDAHKHGK